MSTPDSLVRAVVGKLGSGKSYYTICKILDSLACGLVVVTNVKLNWAACELYLKKQGQTVPHANYRFVSSDEIDKNPDCVLDLLPETGACLVIDEIHLFLNARLWQANQAKAEKFLRFLTMARKKKCDTYLITQDERNADSQLLRMCTHIIRLRNWQHLPLLGKLLPVPLTIANLCDTDGRTRLGREWLWRNKSVYRCYDTYQTFGALELTGQPAARVLGKRSRKIPYALLISAIGGGLLLLDRHLRAAEEEKVRAERDEAAARAAAKPKQPLKVMASPDKSLLPEPVPGEGGLLSRRERAKIEKECPLVYRVTPWGVSLVGGGVITAGDYFLAGIVKGWAVQQNVIRVFIDCPELPEVNLYHANSHRPSVYDFDGGTYRPSLGPPRKALREGLEVPKGQPAIIGPQQKDEHGSPLPSGFKS